MIQPTPNPTGAQWARFRFSVVGSLLSSPPGRGAVKTAIRGLAAKTWSHPVTGRDVQFSAVTIERWYYTARRQNDDPVTALRPPCTKTVARYPCRQKSPSGLFSSTATIRTGATNCTTVTEGLLRLGVVHERTLEGVRFEIPSRYRHFREVAVRYARWDLGRVDLVDERNGTILAPIYPLDRSANADGRRAPVNPDGADALPEESRRETSELPPLLKKILQDYSATGLPPAYLPKTPPSQNGDGS